MVYSNEKVAGTLFFIAASQFVLGLVIAEALYPGYSISANYISDLGVGPSRMIFNSSVFLLGLMLIFGAYFLHRAFNFRVLTMLLMLTAIGAMGVGVFTEHFDIIHLLVSFIAFLFGGLSAIASSRLLKSPSSIVAVILGLMGLGAMVLSGINVNLGLGVGGIERMIVYPLLLWGTGFAGCLIAYGENNHPAKSPSSSIDN
jgi:hypothetical membrane protein